MSMCMFGAPWQKHTSVIMSRAMHAIIGDFGNKICNHTAPHELTVTGRTEEGIWGSSRAASWPVQFNSLIAEAVVRLYH